MTVRRLLHIPLFVRFKAITRPVPGNHEYKNGFLWFLFGGHANPYFTYFTAFPGQAGEAGKGWYTYRHGRRDVYALNPGTKRQIVRDSEQCNWLTQELEGGALRKISAC